MHARARWGDQYQTMGAATNTRRGRRTVIKVSKGRLSKHLLLAGMLCGAVALGAAQAGVPYPTKDTPKPVDLGALDGQAASTQISVTVALSLSDLMMHAK